LFSDDVTIKKAQNTSETFVNIVFAFRNLCSKPGTTISGQLREGK